jgi:hypothetical protein
LNVTRDLLDLGDKLKWDAALAGIPHAFGHSWEGATFVSQATGWPVCLWRFVQGATRVALPLIVRRYQGEPDVTIPSGFSGFACSGNVPDLIEQFRTFGQQQGWVCGYVAQHPLLDLDMDVIRAGFESGQMLHVLDLSPDESSVFSSFARGKRRSILAWASGGGVFSSAQEAIAAFLLRESDSFFDRIGAASSNRLGGPSMAKLSQLPNVLAIAAARDGEVVAVTLFGYAGRLADALYNVSTPAGRTAASALMWEGAKRLRAQGIRLLNMGGGLATGDNVDKSKSGFKGLVRPMRRLKIVFDDARFRKLCAAAGTDPDDRRGYFPPYYRSTVGTP